ncbi:MAG TPA: ribulose-phosphate 3-epimerase [Candidatus Deferrimicrobium sp.]|nr:ribulose-phosphate 3-epimerase [Candidatus Deferrimicrobium sp.]
MSAARADGDGAHPAVLISASILNADFSRLDRVAHKLERAGVDRLHLDVMDGHFVPNLTFGPDVVAAWRRVTDLPLDVHLMIDEPSRYIDRYIAAGPQTITFHVEAPESDEQKDAAIAAIRAAGQGAGLAVSPRTPVQVVADRVALLDVIMIMTVEPGWGGQGFMPEMAPKIAEARALLAAAGRGGLVHVDGGVNHKTAETVGRHGIDVCIVGSALFQRGRDASEEVELVREGVRRGHEAFFASSLEPAAGAPAPIGG